jgi:hypothetical protein
MEGCVDISAHPSIFVINFYAEVSIGNNPRKPEAIISMAMAAKTNPPMRSMTSSVA